MNVIDYLRYVQENRRTPSEFIVVFSDYTYVYIEDIHQFHLDTLCKHAIGVAAHVPAVYELQWFAFFEDPRGGTQEDWFWKREQAAEWIGFHHLQLVKEYPRQTTIKETGLSDAGKYYDYPII